MATYAAWKDVATLYALTEEDNVVPLARQLSMVAEAQKKGALVTTASLPSGHFPMLTMLDRVATMIRDMARANPLNEAWKEEHMRCHRERRSLQHKGPKA